VRLIKSTGTSANQMSAKDWFSDIYHKLAGPMDFIHKSQAAFVDLFGTAEKIENTITNMPRVIQDKIINPIGKVFNDVVDNVPVLNSMKKVVKMAKEVIVDNDVGGIYHSKLESFIEQSSKWSFNKDGSIETPKDSKTFIGGFRTQKIMNTLTPIVSVAKEVSKIDMSPVMKYMNMVPEKLTNFINFLTDNSKNIDKTIKKVINLNKCLDEKDNILKKLSPIDLVELSILGCILDKASDMASDYPLLTFPNYLYSEYKRALVIFIENKPYAEPNTACSKEVSRKSKILLTAFKVIKESIMGIINFIDKSAHIIMGIINDGTTIANGEIKNPDPLSLIPAKASIKLKAPKDTFKSIIKLVTSSAEHILKTIESIYEMHVVLNCE